MTQSGHRPSLNASRLKRYDCSLLGLWGRQCDGASSSNFLAGRRPRCRSLDLRSNRSLVKAGLIVSQGNPTFKANSDWARNVEAAARSLGVALDVITFTGDAVEDAVAAVAANGSQGL